MRAAIAPLLQIDGRHDDEEMTVQVSVLPITDRNNEYAQQVAGRLIDEGFRVEVDTLSGTLGNKIRHAQGQKVPYMFVVGDKEAEAGAVAVRSREEGDLGPQPLEDAIRRLTAENVPA